MGRVVGRLVLVRVVTVVPVVTVVCSGGRVEEAGGESSGGVPEARSVVTARGQGAATHGAGDGFPYASAGRRGAGFDYSNW